MILAPTQGVSEAYGAFLVSKFKTSCQTCYFSIQTSCLTIQIRYLFTETSIVSIQNNISSIRLIRGRRNARIEGLVTGDAGWMSQALECLCTKFAQHALTSVPCFRIWGHFPPLHVLGVGIIFRQPTVPPFHHSTVPAIRVVLFFLAFLPNTHAWAGRLISRWRRRTACLRWRFECLNWRIAYWKWRVSCSHWIIECLEKEFEYLKWWIGLPN